MKIIIDTRETLPLKFNHPYIDKVERKKLDCGDYGVVFSDNFIPPIFFERKSESDLFGTLGKGHNRFKREIIRAQESNIILIVIIEALLTKVLKGYKHSTIKGTTLVKKLFTLWTRYNILPVFCKDREEMAEYITQTFLAFGREHIRKEKD